MELDLLTFFACAECTFNRFMPSWYFFMFSRLLTVVLICRGRLDIVRAIGVAAVLEFSYFFAWRMGVLSMYSNEPGNHIEMIAGLGTLLFEAGLLHAAVFIALARIEFFRVPVAPRLLFRRILVTIPIFVALHFIQQEFAYSSFSSSRPH